MTRLRAAILGCGRIGAGLGWNQPDYIYDHGSAYIAIGDRVSLEWVFDRDPKRADLAGRKFGVLSAGGGDWRDSLREMLEDYPVEVVSICTQPKDRAELLEALGHHNCIKAAWIEKPLAVTVWPEHWKINVGYIRRFDPRHIAIARGDLGRVTGLWIWAKRDIHTVCHFTDLARFWRLGRGQFHYFPMDGPASYVAEMEDGSAQFFPLGGIKSGSNFMIRALGNLLDAVEGKAELVSSAESAIESELWANEILAQS